MRPPTPEEAFQAGASAMQTKLVATLMMRGKQEAALAILEVKPPPFSMPERMELGEGTKGPSDQREAPHDRG